MAGIDLDVDDLSARGSWVVVVITSGLDRDSEDFPPCRRTRHREGRTTQVVDLVGVSRAGRTTPAVVTGGFHRRSRAKDARKHRQRDEGDELLHVVLSPSLVVMMMASPQ